MSLTMANMGFAQVLLPRPVARGLGAGVEIERLVEDGEVVVAHQRRAAPLDDQVHALHRVGAVPDDVTEADDVLHPAPLDLGEDGRKGLQVRVDVADDGKHGGSRMRDAANRT